MFRLLAASLGVGFVSAATGNTTALCQMLLAGPCYSNFGGGTGIWPAAAPTLAQCVTLFNLAVTSLGTDADTSSNTIGCRQYYANMAVDNTTTQFCHFAGFTGGGQCGVPITNACGAILASCNQAITNGSTYLPYNTAAVCNSTLYRMVNIWGSNQGVAAASEDSLECRVYHALVGGLVLGVHCGHVADTLPSPQPCSGGFVAPDAGHYCLTQSNTCTGANLQYSSYAACTNSFAAFPNATVAVTNNNDRGSRQYHTQAAASNPPGSLIHCQHGGPSGGNLVGTTGQAWQSLANQVACAANFSYLASEINNAFANFAAADLNVIVPADTNASFYSTAVTTGNTDTCRIYHLTVASTSPALALVHCSHGDLTSGFPGVCIAAQTPACLMIQTACGTANFPTQAACETAVLAYITAGVAKIGSPNSMNPTDDSIACRLYYATVALALKKAGSSVTTPCLSAGFNMSMGVCVAASSMPPSMMKSSSTPLVASASFLLFSLLL